MQLASKKAGKGSHWQQKVLSSRQPGAPVRSQPAGRNDVMDMRVVYQITPLGMQHTYHPDLPTDETRKCVVAFPASAGHFHSDTWDNDDCGRNDNCTAHIHNPGSCRSVLPKPRCDIVGLPASPGNVWQACGPHTSDNKLLRSVERSPLPLAPQVS
jgi:hypothetical protein